jgi:predicted RND superfamily exporter protein
MSVSAFTSVAGLLSLSFVDSPPLQAVGQISALGTTIGFCLAITVLPLALARSKYGLRSKVRSTLQQWLNAYARSIENQITYAIPGMAILMLLLLGLSRLEVNDDFVDYFDQDTKFRVETDRATDLLSGPNHIEVLLANNDDPGVFDPEYIEYLAELSDFLRAQTYVSSVSSFRDVLEELGEAFDEPLSTSTTAEQLAQWYLVYELSLQRGQTNTDFVRTDQAESRISVLLRRTTSNQIKELEQLIYEWHSRNDSDFQLRVTGENIPVAHLSAINISSMAGGFGASILLITFAVGILLKRLRLALVALIGTLAPLVLGFGAWGALGFTIGLASTAVLAVTIGVVIDDAVHMLYRFIDGRDRLGLDSWHSAAYSVHRAGMAVATTSAVLVAGLSLLLLSAFKVNSTFGAVTCLIITVALLFDLFILPRLLVWSDARSGSTE